MVAMDANIERRKEKIEGLVLLLNHMLEKAGHEERYDLIKKEMN